MPVRLLNSSVMKWPSKEAVVESLAKWSEALKRDSNILSIGYFGSYARGDNGVGSDLDVIIIMEDSKVPFGKRGIEWDLAMLPVPVDLLIYTLDEWNELNKELSYFIKRLREEVKWIFMKDDSLNL
ncbi:MULTISPECIES: nucleotidyltransferase family protein [unclassified Mesotoga]|uniref:nucleotidyltransferase family protein n=1 Tax=unclassified Mesotoga TaxID=1184398 RepID=UPI000DA67CB5|nr:MULTISPECIES: nucleotidyltransferase domain-containing protein [unclassified Mesotoga]PZC53072.1 DNA polymerase [Mesotoga sp. TolDC]